MLEDDPIGTFIAGARRGEWTAPDDALTLYSAYERLDTAEVPRKGTLPSTRQAAAKAILGAALGNKPLPGEGAGDGSRSLDFGQAWSAARDDALRELTEKIHRIDRNVLIVDHLVPALGLVLDEFRTDCAAAGPWATIDPTALPRQLLTEPDQVRHAVLRVIDVAPAKYNAILTAWATLRGPGPRPHMYGYDPAQDITLPTAQIRNWHQLEPAWTHNDQRAWKTGLTHIYLATMLSRGALFWLPTTQQQRVQWFEDFPPVTRATAGGLVSPFDMGRITTP